jgi:hypothetical protein
LINLDPNLTTDDPWSSPLRPGDLSWAYRFEHVREIVLWTVLVLLTRNAVLRIREGYADVRAARWLAEAGPAPSETDVQGWLRPSSGSRTRVSRTRWWHTHPTLSARRRTLQAPHTLLRPGFWETAAAGAALGLSWYYVLIEQSAFFLSQHSPIFLAERWAFATLIALLGTLAAWRTAAFLRQGGAGGWILAARFGAGLGIGLVVGIDLARVSVADGGVGTDSYSLLISPASLSADAVFVLAWMAAGCAATLYARIPDATRGWRRPVLFGGALLVCAAMTEPLPQLEDMAGLPAIFNGTPQLLRGYAEQPHAGAWGTALEETVVYPFSSPTRI